MARKVNQPRLSRIQFFLLHEEDLIEAVGGAIARHLDQAPAARLNDHQEALLCWRWLLADVSNGGFTQFFYNRKDDRGVEELARILDSINVSKAAALLRDAAEVYRRHEAEFDVESPWDGLFGSIKEFDKLDRAFWKIESQTNRAMEKWIRSNIAELAADESGEPIDPDFTGAIETLQPNGLVDEYLEVKKGKPSGAYRKFFDDGTVKKVVFYKAGKVSGDFWPDGQIKHKKSTRGKLTVLEWFYPSGRLQKVMILDKGGSSAEPVRLFHENGQLAEELTVVKGKECGPWLKFFDDGSPQLEAEYDKDRNLIVHNAWDENRKQVVKDGTGVFRNDGRSLNWQTAVLKNNDWQDERELKNGIPHGKMTRYWDGRLWSVDHYENGVRHGDSILYWDNGRVHHVTKYVRGKDGETQEFPKFDRPIPAVVLSVEADEKLYTGWGLRPLDEYPRVLNLEELQRQLRIPDFLREVDERNRSGSIQDDYEDWNKFDDGIAYFLIVNEKGEVASASANGGGIYSARHWETYRPFLMKLRFAPGRIADRAIECRVLARVDHTFVEGKID